MTEETDDEARPDHLDDVEAGGCAELWEQAFELRDGDDNE